MQEETFDYWRADSNRDGTANNLYLRLRTSRKKVWVVRWLKDGALTNRRFGEWPAMLLKTAWRHSENLLAGAGGKDSLKTVADDFYKWRIAPRYRRPKQVRQYLDRIDAALISRPIHERQRIELTRFLAKYSEERAPIAANRMLSILKQVFHFALKRGDISETPIAIVTRDNDWRAEVARAHVLTDHELRRIWNAESQSQPLLRFLLRTAQRIREAQRATRQQINGDRWTIPR